jgi:hypothetical protein
MSGGVPPIKLPRSEGLQPRASRGRLDCFSVKLGRGTRSVFQFAKRLRRDISAIRPADGTACDEEAFELSLVRERPEDFSLKPSGEVDYFVRAIVETNSELVVAKIFGTKDSH